VISKKLIAVLLMNVLYGFFMLGWFLLSGCTTVQEVPVYTPVDVTKVVVAPCIEQKDLPQLPVLATTKIQGHESDCELVNLVLTDRAQLKLYVDQVQGVLAGCVKPASS
jgi:predicted transcriptional regulator